MDKKLNFCPFCGSEDLKIHLSEDRDHYWIGCFECRSSGPLQSSIELASDAWNCGFRQHQRDNIMMKYTPSPTLQQCIDAWNSQADEYNQWSELDSDERCEWVIEWMIRNRWQPIETAPKDGKRIIIAVKYDNGAVIADNTFWDRDGFVGYKFRPEELIYWMPIPDPPEGA